jgi:hypothetical protein
MYIGGGSISIPGDPLSAPFGGDFASLFPGAYQVLQSDRGLTYGGTLLANAANTSTTVVTLTGSLATAPVPIRVKSSISASVGAGAAFDVSFDGGATYPVTLIVPSVATPVALPTPALGLSLTWSAGTGVINDTWDATHAANADQSGNAKNFSQPVAIKQPIVGVGINGKASLLTLAARNLVAESTLALAAPGTQNRTQYFVFRCTANEASQQDFFGGSASGGLAGIVFAPTGNFATSLRQYSGSAGAILAGLSVGTWYRGIAVGTNSTSDLLRVGPNVATGTNSGNAAMADFFVGSGGLLYPSSCEVMLSVWMPGAITSFAAADAAVAAYYGGLVTL